MQRLAFDSLSALALALTALMGAYLPVYLTAVHRRGGGNGRSLTFVLLNMFSAGVMVSAGFCHLLGEAIRLMPQHHTFPLATFLCGTGFLLTLVADKIAHSASGGGQHSCAAVGGPGGPDAKHLGAAVVGAVAAGECVAVLAGIDRAERGGYQKTSHEEEHLLGPIGGSSGHASGTPSPFKVTQQQAVAEAAGSGCGDGDAKGPAHHANGSIQGGSTTSVPVLPAGDASPRTFLLSGVGNGSSQLVHHRHHSATPGSVLELELEASHTGDEAHSEGSAGGVPTTGRQLRAPLVQRVARVSFITAMLMGVALCFHSLLEGAAMGAQETVSNSLHIFIAIVSHKGLAAYALGSSIVESECSSQRFWSVVLPFTLASPAGIFLGYIISDLSRGTGAASLSALASGTFLYVAFMEVIPRELREGSHATAKLAMLVLGFALMSLLAIWA